MWQGYEIMFHVSSFLPYSAVDPQQVRLAYLSLSHSTCYSRHLFSISFEFGFKVL
jgi:hypothetical protein